MRIEWLSTTQAAQALGVSAQTVRDLCQARKLQHLHAGTRGHYRISRDAVDRYIAVHTSGPSDAPRNNARDIAAEQFFRDAARGRI